MYQISLTNVPPSGMVSFYALSTPPEGWLLCNGAAISRTVYSELFDAIGTVYGSGNGTTTFNLPDLRGEFIRGWDDARGIDSGRNIGTWQAMSYPTHTHGIGSFDNNNGFYLSLSAGDYWTTTNANRSFFWNGSGGGSVNAYGPQSNPVTNFVLQTSYNTSYDSSEVRPKNLALLACIKY